MPQVQLSLNSKDAVAGLKAYDRAIGTSEQATDTAFSKIKSHAASIGVAVGAMAAAVSAALVTVGAKALDSASRMQETQNKYDVVFEDMKAQADSWAATLQKDYHLSENASKKYMATIKGILDATGMQSAAAGVLSNKMIQLSLDLGSFNDVRPEQAVEALTAALTGEYEMMKRLGIVMNADEVAQRAMRANNLLSADAVTQAMKAQAAYEIILQKSGKAVGDVARSQASYVTQLNELNKVYDNTLTKIGQQLIPIATQFLTIFNNWNNTTNTATTLANGFNTALQWTVNVVQFVHNGINGLILIGNAWVLAWATGVNSIVSGLQLVMGAIEQVGAAMVQLGVFDENPFQGMVDGVNSLKETTENMQASAKQVYDEHIKTIEKVNSTYDSFAAKIESVRAKKEEDVKWTKTQQDALDEWTKGGDAAIPKLHEYGNALDIVREKTVGYNAVAIKAKNLTTEQATEYSKLYSAFLSAQKAVQAHAAEIKNNATPAALQYHEALKKLAEDASKELEAFDKTTEAVKEATVARKASNDMIYSEIKYVQDATGQWVEYDQAVRNAADAAEEAAKKREGGGGGDLGKKVTATGGFSARGGLSVEQWQSLPKDVQDRLAKEALLGGQSTWDYFSNKSGNRFRGTDPQLAIDQRAQAAYQFEGLRRHETSTTINNYFSQQVSRSDISSIIEESQRSLARA